MEKIYITGHRNPDLDSVCASYAYAVLKNKIDSDNKYFSVRCGHLSEFIKAQLSAVDLSDLAKLVPYMRDVYPKVKDVMQKEDVHIQVNEPIFKFLKNFSRDNLTASPIFENGKFFGLLCIDDILDWILKDNLDEVPLYNIMIDNLSKVLPGDLVKKGHDVDDAVLLVGAGDLESFKDAIDKNPNSIFALGYRKEYVDYAIKAQIPIIVLTIQDTLPELDLSGYNGTVFVTSLGTAETIRRLRLAVSIRGLISADEAPIKADVLFDVAKDMVVSSKKRGLSIEENGEWIGFVTSKCFLNKPSYNVILVDHNEVDQSIRGIETATVREIIDHHRLDALKTNLPIFIDAEPVGSTCSIIYQQFIRNSVVPDKLTSKVLLTGILSDTLILRSPTTTDIDRSSAGALAAMCGIFDINAYGEKLFSCSENMENADENAVINSDFKVYNEKGRKIGIGQCEVSTLRNVSSYSEKFIASLNKIREEGGFDWTMLMVTDVLRECSVLLCSNSNYNEKLPFHKLGNNVYDMPKIVSRKKQLLSEVLNCLE